MTLTQKEEIKYLEQKYDKKIRRIRFYLRARPYIWSAIMLVVGILGGNVDRIAKYVEYTTPIQEDYQNLENRIERLENILNVNKNNVFYSAALFSYYK